MTVHSAKNPTPLWYKNAVFYQVYVRAFCDSNGDGHGDFPTTVEEGLGWVRKLVQE